MAQATAPTGAHYFRSDSSDSAAYMLPASERPKRLSPRCSPIWLAVAAMGIAAVQVAATAALFIHFGGSVAKLRAQAQGSLEELKCLSLLNRLQDLSVLEELMDNPLCLRLATGVKDYVTMVTENAVQKRTQPDTTTKVTGGFSEGQFVGHQVGSKPTAHLTLRRQSSESQPGSKGLFGEMPQSCQHPIPHWANRTLHSHVQNLTYQDGKLHVSQAGKYYIYAQIYFRYPTEGAGPQASGHQLVQCINLQSSYGQNILLLKGVGTKCWAQDATYGLHALYQGGLFDLKAGDKLFISVSSLDISYNDEASSYFGAFRLDV